MSSGAPSLRILLQRTKLPSPTEEQKAKMISTREDQRTNTLDGAAAFEAARAEEYDERLELDWDDDEFVYRSEDPCTCGDVLHCPECGA